MSRYILLDRRVPSNAHAGLLNLSTQSGLRSSSSLFGRYKTEADVFARSRSAPKTWTNSPEQQKNDPPFGP